MNKRDALIALLGLAASPICSIGQSLRRVACVGVLGVTSAAGLAAELIGLAPDVLITSGVGTRVLK